MISAVFVSYRSAPLAARAVDSFRQDAERAGLAPEVVVVVNSGDEGEAAALSRVADRVLLPGENLGYAGGLNAGIAASHGDPVVLANPDLVFLPGSVAALAGAVARGGLAVAGPALFWDDAATLLLPPVEEPRPAELVRRALALDPARNGLPFRREVRRALAREAAVREGRSVEASGLSGALLVATRATLGTVGPFDERYRLYYEENDWQRRLRAAGGRVLFCGAARVVHRYAQSSRREARAEAWFHESERRYFESHFGDEGRRALARAASAVPGRGPDLATAASLSWKAGEDVLVAVAPVPVFRPFVLARPPAGATTFALPPEVRSGHPDVPWYARAFDRETFATLAEARLSSLSGSGGQAVGAD